MAKKTDASTTVVGNFDALSSGQYASETGAQSSNASDDAGAEPIKTGDAEADKMLNTLMNRETSAKKEVKDPVAEADLEEEEQQEEEQEQEEEKEEEANEEQQEEEQEEEKVDPKVDKTKIDKKDKKDPAAEADDDNKELSFDDAESAAAPDTESNGWKDVAKELNFELDNDDFDTFKEKLAEKTEYNLARFKPETQRVIKFTEAGGTINDFLEPLAKVDAALMLPNADLVDRHLEAQGWKDPEKRQKELERMIESGQADVVAESAKATLKSYRKEVMDGIINDRIKLQEKFEARAANAPKEEAKAIRAQLESKKEFMGTKLSPENIEKIVKNYESGKYHEAMKNSEDIAAFALWKEFGKMGEKNLMIKAQRELKEKHKEKFHKVPPTVGGTAGTKKATSSGQDPLGNFDALEKGKV